MAASDIGVPPRDAKDEALAAALARGLSTKAAAAEAGVSQRTAFRRLEDVGFTARVEELRANLVELAVRRLSDHMQRAADRLSDLLESSNDTVALGAARSILDLGLKSHEQRSLETRVEALERQKRNRGRRRW